MYQAPRGTHDLLPDAADVRRQIATVAERVAGLAGYRSIETPTFENADIFIRGVGAGTDIVEKEMYTFDDRGGVRMALRPEGTASICRAYLEHGMSNDPQPSKLQYILPIFRYERPQAGRFRQHTQFGIEAIGMRDPALDAEVIDIGWRITQELGLDSLTLLINSIGDQTDRASYVPILRAHFDPHLPAMCGDCQTRHKRAPLRLLDCKKTSCTPFQSNAPEIREHLRPESRDFFKAVKENLAAMGIPVKEKTNLVRGLDYYTHTVFEIVPEETGSQVTLLAGGRYDGLIEELGGPNTPGIGFGMGLERIASNLQSQKEFQVSAVVPTVLISTIGTESGAIASQLASQLRQANISATMTFGKRSLKAQLRHAHRSGASLVVIIGDREAQSDAIELLDLALGKQHSVSLSNAVTEIQKHQSSSEK